MTFIERPSPNFNARKDGEKISMLVIHYTGMKSLPEVLDRLCDPAAKVSAHYVVDEDGGIYRLVDESKRAWHAGVSRWQGRDDVNSASIGIEVMNPGDKPFTPAQLTALTILCQDIIARHGITPNNVVGHSDVAPDRKEDPGPYFPWRKMAKLHVGHWPKPRLRDTFAAAADARRPKRLKELFRKAGYGVDVSNPGHPTLEQLLAAFQSRYEPSVFMGKNRGKPQISTVAKLRAAARHNARCQKRFTKE